MKEIMAIIRMNCINQTKSALLEAGFPAFTAVKVLGRGQGSVDFSLLEAAANGTEEAIAQLGNPPRLIPKRLIFLVAPDEQVDLVVRTILEVNQTGRPGDGKIFVMPISDAVRVRTGEVGELAVNEAGA